LTEKRHILLLFDCFTNSRWFLLVLVRSMVPMCFLARENADAVSVEIALVALWAFEWHFSESFVSRRHCDYHVYCSVMSQRETHYIWKTLVSDVWTNLWKRCALL